MFYRSLDIGDIVYIFRNKDDYKEKIKENNFVVGEVINYKLSDDIGYNMCEERVYLYDVKVENKIYEGTHRINLYGWFILKTKDELISDIETYIWFNNKVIKNDNGMEENELLQNVLDKLEKKSNVKKKVKRNEKKYGK